MSKTRNMQSLFPSKDKNGYISCVMYIEHYSCGSSYMAETKRNAEVRWNEHNNLTRSSEPSAHFHSKIKNYLTWIVIPNASRKLRPARA